MHDDLGSFRLPDEPHPIAPAPADDEPVVRADTMHERAGQVFRRQRDRRAGQRAAILSKPNAADFNALTPKIVH